MIYIIISNIGMAIMMIVVYGRYSKFRISSSKEIYQLRAKLDQATEESKHLTGSVLEGAKSESEKVEKLLRELNNLRKEKENEIKLRLEAEKQIELALQRTEDIQKRINDWRVIQDSVMKDSKDAIIKVGNDLFKKLSDNYKIEVGTNRGLISNIGKNIAELSEKVFTVKNTPATPKSNSEASSANMVMDDQVKKLVLDLVNTMKANGLMVNKDYFLPANFLDKNAKMMLCEITVNKNNILYIIDFKACRYLDEYNQMKAQNKVMAEDTLKQKLDKYLAYLTNPKYCESILKVMASTSAKFEKNNIIIVTQSKAEIQVIKEIQYYEKARKAGFEIMHFDEVNNMVL